MRTNQFACYSFTMEAEGGFSTDSEDPGNWTGCAVGAGELKGTNQGISACAYPDLDLASLTEWEIFKIYDRDYWDVVWGDQLPRGVDLCVWDGGVNCGPGTAVGWLQMASGNPHVDGGMGPETMEYVQKCDDIDGLIDDICEQRMNYYRSLSTWPRYGEGWTQRTNDCRALAHEMATQQTPAPKAVTITIVAAAGVEVQVIGP